MLAASVTQIKWLIDSFEERVGAAAPAALLCLECLLVVRDVARHRISFEPVAVRTHLVPTQGHEIEVEMKESQQTICGKGASEDIK